RSSRQLPEQEQWVAEVRLRPRPLAVDSAPAASSLPKFVLKPAAPARAEPSADSLAAAQGAPALAADSSAVAVAPLARKLASPPAVRDAARSSCPRRCQLPGCSAP